MTSTDPTLATVSTRPRVGLPARVPRSVLLAGLGVLLVLGYLALHGRYPFPAALVLDVKGFFQTVNDWILANRNTSPLFLYGLNHVANWLTGAVGLVYRALVALTVPGLVACSVGLALWVAGQRVALGVLAAFVVFGALGVWDESLQTIALMVASVLIALAIGVPAGVMCGRSDRWQRVLAPVLDTMQILPAFAYLLPVALLFGVGVPAAAVATIVYAIPPAVRLTSLGIRGVPPSAVEATTSLGSTSWQVLRKAQLPAARSQIMLGVNQTIMMALSMVVIASVVGAGGLGDLVLQALNNVDVGAALNAGIAIVVLAIALDRVTAKAGRARDVAAGPVVALSLFIAAAGVVFGYATGINAFPDLLTGSVAGPVNTGVEWVQSTFSDATSTFAAWFIAVVLDPLRSLLAASPWWLVVGAATAVGAVVGGLRAAVPAGLSLLLIGVLGTWDPAMATLAQVVAATALTLVLGVAFGVAVAGSRALETAVRPVLDAMQTLPQFVYLIPVVALFGVGRTPGVIASVVYALPVVVRITADGIRGVSDAAVESATMSGSSRWQLLVKVRLPLARPALRLAVNQAIMMVLAVVIIGGLVGSGALGYAVVVGLAQNQLGTGVVAGVAIVCLGVLLDRITSSPDRSTR